VNGPDVGFTEIEFTDPHGLEIALIPAGPHDAVIGMRVFGFQHVR
jgi:hypothetical protein